MAASRKPTPDQIKAVYDFVAELRTIMHKNNFDMTGIKFDLVTSHFLERYRKKIPSVTLDTDALPKAYSTTDEIDPLTYFMHDSQDVIPKAIQFFLDTKIKFEFVYNGSSYDEVPTKRYEAETSIIYSQLERIMRRTKGLMQGEKQAKDATKLTAAEAKERKHPHDAKLTLAQISENVRSFELLLQALQQLTAGKAIDSKTQRAIINCRIHFEASRTDDYFRVKQYKAVILQIASKEHKHAEEGIVSMIENMQGFLAEFREKPARLYKEMNQKINSLMDGALASIHSLCVDFHTHYSGSSHLLQGKTKTQQKVTQLDFLARMSNSLTWDTLASFNATVNTVIDSYVAEHKVGFFGRSKNFTRDDFNRRKPSNTTATHLRILQGRTAILMTYHEILASSPDIEQLKSLLTRVQRDLAAEHQLLGQLKRSQVDNSFSKFLTGLSWVLSDMRDYLVQSGVKEDKDREKSKQLRQ